MPFFILIKPMYYMGTEVTNAAINIYNIHKILFVLDGKITFKNIMPKFLSSFHVLWFLQPIGTCPYDPRVMKVAFYENYIIGLY